MNTDKKNLVLMPFNLLYKISPKAELKLLFRLKQGYRLNLKNPITFNEKIQWIKLYDKNPLMPKCVDKYTVREYVKSKGCKEILNELLWEGSNPNDIPYDDLPNKFVIKVTHGSTFNIICTDKSKLNIEETNKKLKIWLKEKFLPCYGEWFYGVVRPRIIVEKFIESNEGLKDYKVFCFNGVPKYIGVYSDRSSGKTKQELYDTNWNEIDGKTGNFENQLVKTKKPSRLLDLLKYASILSEDFKHARIDFFIENEKIYFGEITFTSGAGFDKFSSKNFDKKMGDCLELYDKHNIKVLMVGPARSVKGGMTTVVDNYYQYGLHQKVDLKYIETCNDSNRISKYFKEKKGLKEFKKYIESFDIVHVHVASRRSTFRKGKYVRIAKSKGKKVILHIHGAEYKIFYNECSDNQKEHVKQILNLADKIIVLSEEWKDYFKNLVNEDKIYVLYNSIIIPENFHKDLNTGKMLFLGRIGKRKGIYDLVEVVEKLIPQFPSIKLYVGGDGEVEYLQQLIKEKNLNKNIEYVGWTSGVQKEQLLKESSFYVLPSYNEGMPMSLLEGMAYKNVVISTKVGGIPKVIKNGENGIIIEPGDKDALYNNLTELLMDKEKRVKLSSGARKTMEEKFDIKKNIDVLIDLYCK